MAPFVAFLLLCLVFGGIVTAYLYCNKGDKAVDSDDYQRQREENEEKERKKQERKEQKRLEKEREQQQQ